jgi:hypothetical protein
MATMSDGCGGVVRVLFVAPAAPGLPALRWWNELAEMTEVEGAQVELVVGASATIDRVAKTLRRGADIIVFSGHGMQNQIILSDGRRVSGEWIATQARKTPPEVILVGACLSGARDGHSLESIGEAISQAGIHAVVFEAPIEDASAAVFSTEFVRSMVAVFDVVRANRVATMSAAQVCMDTAAAARLVPGVVNGYREFVRRLDAMDCRISQLSAGQDMILQVLQRRSAEV